MRLGVTRFCLIYAKYLPYVRMSITQKAFILTLFCLTPLVYSPALLDYFHHSRFLFASGVLLIFGLLFAGQANKIGSFPVHAVDIVLWLFIATSAASIAWAHQRSEALFYTQKWFVLAGTIFGGKIIFSRNRRSAISFLQKCSIALTLVIMAVVGWHVFKISSSEGFSNRALYQLKAVFGHKSLISAYLFLLIPLNLLNRNPLKNQGSSWSYLVVLTQVIFIVLLQSRAIYLALFTFFIICGLFFYRNGIKSYSKKAVKILGGMVLIFLLAGIFTQQWNNDLATRLNPLNYFESQTASERRFVWFKTQSLIFDHPFTGVGAGNWKIEFPKFGVEGAYRLQDQNVIFTRAHNDFLEILAELGVGGLLLYALFFAIPVLLLLRPSPKYRWQRSMLLGGLLGFVISSLIDFPKERTEFLVILGFYMALVPGYVKPTQWINLDGNKLRMLWIFTSVLLIGNVYVGLHRYVGEHKMQLLLKARVKQQWVEVESLANEAQNRWHKLDPSAVPISFYRGIAQYSQNKQDEALTSFLMALNDNPYNFHVLNNIGTVKVSQGKYHDAMEYLYRALRINPRFEDALFNLSYCLNALGRHKEALEQVTLIPQESEKKQLFIREITKSIENSD